jgi:ribosomal protein S18 acetylase RimI-like enzyme
VLLTKYWEDLKTLPGDARVGYRHEGAPGLWKALAGRVFHRVFRAGRVIVFAHRLEDRLEPGTPPGVEIRNAGLGDVRALASIAGRREADRAEKLLTNGRHCLIAWRGDQPVGYAWVADHAGPDIIVWPMPFDLPAGAAYLWNLYVLPRERSSGIGSALALARLRLARERGFQEGWRMVAPSNGASLRTVRKSATSTRVVGEVRFVQLFSRAYCRFIPAAPTTEVT